MRVMRWRLWALGSLLAVSAGCSSTTKADLDPTPEGGAGHSAATGGTGATQATGGGGGETASGGGTGGSETGGSEAGGGGAGGSTCDPSEQPDGDAGVFVSATSGNDQTGNGAALSPVRSIAKGLQIASAAGKSLVYLDVGVYAERVVLTSAEAGITVRGGFSRTGTQWARNCEARALTLIQSPDSVGVEVNGTTEVAGLRELTVTTRAAGESPHDSAGESVYGVRVTGTGTKFSLIEVSVLVGDGGDGGKPSPAASPTPPSGTCEASCSNGLPGDAAMPSTEQTPEGTFDASGFQPGDGAPGASGTQGQPGPPGAITSGQCTQCSGCGDLFCFCSCEQTGCGNYCGAGTYSQATVDTAPGPCGCGGPGGLGGSAGRGGGASVAVFASGAVTVFVRDSSLAAGAGGDGSPGGAPSDGAEGSEGQVATASCAQGNCECALVGGAARCGTSEPATTLTSQVGGPGGKGGAGANGRAGAGGPSYAVVLIGSATLADERSDLVPGPGGAGADGAPAGATGARLVLP